MKGEGEAVKVVERAKEEEEGCCEAQNSKDDLDTGSIPSHRKQKQSIGM